MGTRLRDGKRMQFLFGPLIRLGFAYFGMNPPDPDSGVLHIVFKWMRKERPPLQQALEAKMKNHPSRIRYRTDGELFETKVTLKKMRLYYYGEEKGWFFFIHYDTKEPSEEAEDIADIIPFEPAHRKTEEP